MLRSSGHQDLVEVGVEENVLRRTLTMSTASASRTRETERMLAAKTGCPKVAVNPRGARALGCRVIYSEGLNADQSYVGVRIVNPIKEDADT